MKKGKEFGIFYVRVKVFVGITNSRVKRVGLKDG